MAQVPLDPAGASGPAENGGRGWLLGGIRDPERASRGGQSPQRPWPLPVEGQATPRWPRGLGGTTSPSACLRAAALPTWRLDTSWRRAPRGALPDSRAGGRGLTAPARPARSRVARRSEFSCSKPPAQCAGRPQRCGAGQRLAAGGRRTRHVRAPLRTNDLSAVTPTRTWPADGRGTEASVLPGGPRHCSVHTEEQGRRLRACGPRAQTRAGGSQRKRANRSEHGSPPISRFCSRSPPDQPVLLTVLPLSSAQRLCADANPLT